MDRVIHFVGKVESSILKVIGAFIALFSAEKETWKIFRVSETSVFNDFCMIFILLRVNHLICRQLNLRDKNSFGSFLDELDFLHSIMIKLIVFNFICVAKKSGLF